MAFLRCARVAALRGDYGASGVLPHAYGARYFYCTCRGDLRAALSAAYWRIPKLAVAELGAGTAAKTGILLEALTRRQPEVIYQPIDVSETALDEAREHIEQQIPGVTVYPQVADYTTDKLSIERPEGHRVLALYIGSSIGNFSPEERAVLLRNLRQQLRAGDALLLGLDLAPGAQKPVETLLAAYDDAAGITAAFNRNVLTRLNRELGAGFRPQTFRHQARWNAAESRIEMHLESVAAQTVRIPANSAGPEMVLDFVPGLTIHTESSYKFTNSALLHLLHVAGFAETKTWSDERGWFAVTLAEAI